MNRGMPVDRTFVCVLGDGSVCVDWGDGRMQDVLTGGFRAVADNPSVQSITEVELEALVRQGVVAGFDARYVYLLPLPEKPPKTID